MRTQLDDLLFALLDELPEAVALLGPDERRMIDRRREGASLVEIGTEFNLTKAGVRRRLYGKGCGLRRGGGVLGQLRALARRKQRQAAG